MQNRIKHQTITCVLLASIGLASAGCEKLDQPENFPAMEAIPATFGELVNVTQDPHWPYAAVLWFEQPDKTIVAVRVNISRGEIATKTVKFTRS